MNNDAASSVESTFDPFPSRTATGSAPTLREGFRHFVNLNIYMIPHGGGAKGWLKNVKKVPRPELQNPVYPKKDYGVFSAK